MFRSFINFTFNERVRYPKLAIGITQKKNVIMKNRIIPARASPDIYRYLLYGNWVNNKLPVKYLLIIKGIYTFCEGTNMSYI